MVDLGNIDSPDSRLVESGLFKKAFEYLRCFFMEDSRERLRLLSMVAGEVTRVELGGGLFAMEQSYITREKAEARFESHKRYIDIQAVIQGEELIQTEPVNGMTVASPYDTDSDLVFYHDGADISDHHLKAGMFAVFHPSDGHKPGLRYLKPARVFKTVVKVPFKKDLEKNRISLRGTIIKEKEIISPIGEAVYLDPNLK